MAQQIGAMVYAETHQRKTAHLPHKKEIPGDQGPYNEGTGETSVMRDPPEVQEGCDESEDSELARIRYQRR
jgi:hypothetical protein